MSATKDRTHPSSRWLIAGSGKRLYQLATLPEMMDAGSIVGLWSPYRDERCAAAQRFAVPTADRPLDLLRELRPDLTLASVLTEHLVNAATDVTPLALLGPLEWLDGARGLKALLHASHADIRTVLIPSPIMIFGTDNAEGAISVIWHSPVGVDRMTDLVTSGQAPFALSSRATTIVASLLAKNTPKSGDDPFATAIETIFSRVDNWIELRGKVAGVGVQISMGTGPAMLSTSQQASVMSAMSRRFATDHPRFLVDFIHLLQTHSWEAFYNDGTYASIALRILKEATR